MDHRRLGRTPFELSPIGFGAFKIGRNEGIKYEHAYTLPTDDGVARLLRGVLDLGVNYFDTAPAYGLSEQRLGQWLPKRDDVVISTKVGENFVDGESSFDFTATGVRKSIDRSRRLLKRDTLNIVLVHSGGDDLNILTNTDVVAALQTLKDVGVIQAIGFSGKSVEGVEHSLVWADAIMVEYHINDQSHQNVIVEAARRGVGVIVKKPLASGRLPPEQAIEFLLRNKSVASMVIGGLDLNHFRSNIAIAERFSGS